MLNGTVDTRRVYESFCSGASASGGQTGPAGFRNFVLELCGLSVDRMGRRFVSRTIESGPDKGRASFAPEAMGFKDLAIGLIGEDWVNSLDPSLPRSISLPNHEQLRAIESASGAVGPGSFPNVSAWVSTVSGLMEVKTLDAFNSPEHIGITLVRLIPTRLRREKMPAIGRIGDQAQLMGVNEPHPRVGLDERYVWTPETAKRGLGIDVNKEAVFFDLTGQVLMRAGTLGEEMALNRDKRIWRVILGIDNPYNYNDVSYNTYTSSGVVINTLVALLQDWTDLNEARTLASRMTDQESGERISPNFDVMWVMPGREDTANYIANATEVEQRTNSSAEVRRGANREAGRHRIVSSPIAEQVLIDSGVSAADALETWGLLNSNNAFGYWENWSAQTYTPSASDYEMADRGIIFSQFVDEMGAAGVLERRYAIKATPS